MATQTDRVEKAVKLRKEYVNSLNTANEGSAAAAWIEAENELGDDDFSTYMRRCREEGIV